LKLLFENWREFLNEKMMLKPGENGWDLYRQLVGQAYMEAPMEQPGAKASYEALGEWVNKFFERVVGVVDVEFVDYHPYKSSKQMIKQVQEDGVLLVSTADAEHPIFDAETNAKFRTVHDFGGHIQRKVPFSYGGELKAYNTHVKMVPPVAVPALFTEIVGQISCFYLNNKKNCPQKMVILDQFDFVNVGEVQGYTIVNKELVKDEKEKVQEQESGLPPGFQGFDVDDTEREPDHEALASLDQGDEFVIGRRKQVYRVTNKAKDALIKYVTKVGTRGRNKYEVRRVNPEGFVVAPFKVIRADGTAEKKPAAPPGLITKVGHTEPRDW